MSCKTPLREIEQAAGAQFAEYFGCLMPESFGDVREEYRRLREGAALLDKNYRVWLDFTGPDRARYLNAVLTNNVRDLQPGHGLVNLLLNPQGHILAELETYAMADRIRVATYQLNCARTIETLERFIIMDDVTITDVTDQLGAIAVEGPKTAQVLAGLGAPSLDSLEELQFVDAEIADVKCQLLKRSPGGVPSAEFVTSRADLPKLWNVLLDAVRTQGGGPTGYAALSAIRLKQGIAWYGYDFGDAEIPHEAGLENSHISYAKGCYTGQEIVERVRSRGHANRKRAGVAFSGETVPPANTELTANGASVGHVTRAAFSYALNRPIAMAYLRREFTPPGSKVSWSGGQGEVIALPISARSSERSA
jgi:folate-binding protein YgfZ